MKKQWITLDGWVSISKNVHPVVKSLTPWFDRRWPQTSGSPPDCRVLRTSSHFHTCRTRWRVKVRLWPCWRSASVCSVWSSRVQGSHRSSQGGRLAVAEVPGHPSNRPTGTTALMLSSVFCRWATCLWVVPGSLCSPLWLKRETYILYIHLLLMYTSWTIKTLDEFD